MRRYKIEITEWITWKDVIEEASLHIDIDHIHAIYYEGGFHHIDHFVYDNGKLTDEIGDEVDLVDSVWYDSLSFDADHYDNN